MIYFVYILSPPSTSPSSSLPTQLYFLSLFLKQDKSKKKIKTDKKKISNRKQNKKCTQKNPWNGFCIDSWALACPGVWFADPGLWFLIFLFLST